MRDVLFVIALLVVVAAGAALFASLVKYQSQWAYQACANAYGLCDRPMWIGLIVAAAAVAALGLRATEI